MGSQRDAFGSLPPLRREAGSGRCVVQGCERAPRHARAGMTTSYEVCDHHVGDWDSGRIVGSLIVGYRVQGED